eukprot:Opistho-2@57918
MDLDTLSLPDEFDAPPATKQTSTRRRDSDQGYSDDSAGDKGNRRGTDDSGYGSTVKKSRRSYDDEEQAAEQPPAKRRKAAPAKAAAPSPQGSDMQDIFGMLKASYNMNQKNKQTRIETITQDAIKTGTSKMEKLYRVQAEERARLLADIDAKCTHNCKAMQTHIGQQERVIRQLHENGAKLVRQLANFGQQAVADMASLEADQVKQKESLKKEFVTEMTALQKKMTEASKAQDVANLRRSLESMLPSLD